MVVILSRGLLPGTITTRPDLWDLCELTIELSRIHSRTKYSMDPTKVPLPCAPLFVRAWGNRFIKPDERWLRSRTSMTVNVSAQLETTMIGLICRSRSLLCETVKHVERFGLLIQYNYPTHLKSEPASIGKHMVFLVLLADMRCKKCYPFVRGKQWVHSASYWFLTAIGDKEKLAQKGCTQTKGTLAFPHLCMNRPYAYPDVVAPTPVSLSSLS